MEVRHHSELVLGRRTRGPFQRSRTMEALSDIDVDPGWYPGQPELDNAGVDNVPTVLTKLKKWADYESVGEPVVPTKFLPMKTPLSCEIMANWSLSEPPTHQLTIPQLFAGQAAVGRTVGMILDLANHDCLYSEDIPAGILYNHIQLVAKELPSLEFVEAVRTVANEFWVDHPDQYIAIHCAYGFNRTGFVVCCFLIEECQLTVDEALHAFATSRPPGVKHEKFREELYRRYAPAPSGCMGSTVTAGSELTSRTQSCCADGVLADDNSSLGCSPADLQDSASLVSAFALGALRDAVADNGNFDLDATMGLALQAGLNGVGIPLVAPSLAQTSDNAEHCKAAPVLAFGSPASIPAMPEPAGPSQQGGKSGIAGETGSLTDGFGLQQPITSSRHSGNSLLAQQQGSSDAGRKWLEIASGGRQQSGVVPVSTDQRAMASALSGDGDNDSLGVNDRQLLATFSRERNRPSAGSAAPLGVQGAAEQVVVDKAGTSAKARVGLRSIEWGQAVGTDAAVIGVQQQVKELHL